MERKTRAMRTVKAGHYTRVKVAGVYLYIANENRKMDVTVGIGIYPTRKATKR